MLALIIIIKKTGSYPIFSFQMHVMGAYLKLRDQPVRSKNSCMQALIPVHFWYGDIVLKLPKFRFKKSVNYAESAVTVLPLRHQNSNRDRIIHLIQTLVLRNNFFINAIKIFLATINHGF